MRVQLLLLRFLWLAVWLGPGGPAWAALTRGGAAVSVTNPSAFLLASEVADPVTGKDGGAVMASLSLELSHPGLVAEDDDLEVEAGFRLVRQSDGVAMLLRGEPEGVVLTATRSFTLPAGGRRVFDWVAGLRLVETLDPADAYRVTVSLRSRGRDGEWSEPEDIEGGWRRWVHFAGTEVDDGSLNVKAFVNDLRITGRRILRGGPGEEGFGATVEVTLHRYDLESSPQPAAVVPVTFRLRLMDRQNGGEVALARPTWVVTRELPARSGGLGREPATLAWVEALAFEPAPGAVLDPLAEYILVAGVEVGEPDGTTVGSVPGSVSADPERYLVLSGRLHFGGVQATYRRLSNDPQAVMSRGADGVLRTELAVATGEGLVAVVPTRRFGGGTPLVVRYDPATGDSTVLGGRQALTTGETDVVVLGGWRFVRGVIRLEEGGAVLESGGVLLPAGFGISESQRSMRHRPALETREILLNSELTPAKRALEFTPQAGRYFYAMCDRLPLRFRTSSIRWDVDGGTLVFSQVPTGDPADPAGPTLARHFAEAALAALRPLLKDESAADRPGTDALLMGAVAVSDVAVGVGARGEALLSVDLELSGGEMRTHFPEGVRIAWSHGQMRLERNRVSRGSSVAVPDPITVEYARDCVGNCGTASGSGWMVFRPGDRRMEITADGGLRGTGEVVPERLRWGTTELAGGGTPPEGGFPYAHQTSQWFEGTLHAAGGWLSGEDVEGLEAEARPQAVLLSGVLPEGGYERPGGAGYRAGLADYAGLNLRVGAGVKTGRSVLAGVMTPDYPLKARCKYYVRAGGVTGIHEATVLRPSNLRMYDFDVVLDGFRLAFRDGLNVESKTGGSVHVPSPVQPPGFDLAFKELRFECRGQPSRMQLANEGETKSLTYWRTDIVPLSLKFAQPLVGNCPSVSAGFLEVGVETRFPSVTPQKLHATLGFMANGNLVTRANPLSAGLNLDSRFTLPPNLELVGAGGVPWSATVVGRAYLNNPVPGRPNPDGTGNPYTPTPADFRRPEQGFLTFPATLNVPWFEDVKVQLQVSSSSAADAESAIHVVDGEGWKEGARTFFADKFFDTDHLGFPAAAADAKGQRMSVGEYRNAETAEYNPRARKRWLGVVDFDFPLVWEGTQRRFRSKPQTADLLVLGAVDRQLQSLSPSTAEITFGVQLAIPRVNAQSLVAAVKEGIANAVADALAAAVSGEVRNQLGTGLDQLDGVLSERLAGVLTEPVRAAAGPVADAILGGAAPGTQVNLLTTGLTTLPDAGLLGGLGERLTAGMGALDAVLAVVGTAGDRGAAGRLVRELLKRTGIPGAGELGEAAVRGALAEALPKIEPDLERAEEVLLRARAALARGADPGAKLAGQVRAAFAGTAPELARAAGQAMADVTAAMAGHEWSVATEAERRARIHRLVSERVLSSVAVPKFQYVVRQHVQDANEAFRGAMDDVFGQVNHLVREVIRAAVRNGSRELADALGETRSPAAGEMGPSSGGSGKLAGLDIEGYAQINDESLRVLDLNGKFEFNVPDALRVQAHLRIQEYDANAPASGCRPAGVSAAVVQIDARAECEWIGAAGTMVEVGAKFSLQDGKPTGFDGYFGLEGDIRLGPIVVTEARLMAGFGGFRSPGGEVNHWAYVGAKVRGRFNAYEAGVGLFFGRTCDAGVIRMIDPDVGTVLDKAVGRGSGPMTGVYFYGEAWIPVNEVFGIPSTCLFTVRATAGAGFFAFVHDNGSATIGCKQKFGADGRLLCIFGISGEMRIIGALTTAGQPTPVTGAPAGGGLYQRADKPDTSKGSFVLLGVGEFSAELGICPFCLELSKSVGLTWKIGGDDAGLDIEF